MSSTPAISQERIFTVLVAPHFTEKASIEGDKSNQYTFKVSPDSTKAEIKAAVEQLFEVKVTGVSTLNVKGKTKRTQRGVSRSRLAHGLVSTVTRVTCPSRISTLSSFATGLPATM